MKGRGVGVEDKLSLENLVSCSLLPIGVASSAFRVSARSLVSSFIFVVGIVLHCFRLQRNKKKVENKAQWVFSKKLGIILESLSHSVMTSTWLNTVVILPHEPS